MMFSVKWIQHPVGHGGFHTGTLLSDDGNSYHWAFDCGSRRTARFDDYLKAWARRNPHRLDWLFISHFDTDHVSGLSTLMSNVVVDQVMIPYLNEREFAYVLLHEIARGNLSQDLVDAVADPTGFFAARGAQRVVYLRGRGDGAATEEDPESIGTDPRTPAGGRDWQESIKPAGKALHGSPAIAAMDGAIESSVIDGGACEIWLDCNGYGLRLKPYRAPIGQVGLKGIIQDIEALVGRSLIGPLQPGLGNLAYAVARHARTAAGRASLREILKHYVGSSNRASLSLLTIPIASGNGHGHWWINRPDAWAGGPADPPACLNTGDAELLAPADLRDWENFYQPELDEVRVLALPHHGSDKNSDGTLQQLCQHAVLAAHVRSNNKKHPGSMVITHAGTRLVEVTEHFGTALEMHYREW